MQGSLTICVHGGNKSWIPGERSQESVVLEDVSTHYQFIFRSAESHLQRQRNEVCCVKKAMHAHVKPECVGLLVHRVRLEPLCKRSE